MRGWLHVGLPVGVQVVGQFALEFALQGFAGK